ncbi:MAG: hypothetical protein ACM31C_32870 [Acidobacteriota bacterium]
MYLAIVLAACSSSSAPVPDAVLHRIDAAVRHDAPMPDAGMPACQWTSGLFQCGQPTDNTSCDRETHFCVVGDPVYGVSCKAIGGDGSTCPRCDVILPIAQQYMDCGSNAQPTCSGDETTGITITCQ